MQDAFQGHLPVGRAGVGIPAGRRMAEEGIHTLWTCGHEDGASRDDSPDTRRQNERLTTTSHALR